MDILLYNIQGFRGEHRYSIDDYVTIINSKHNGVGKTTLYDCLKFLCDSTQVDKEEQEFFLNLNEEQGLFAVTKNDVTYGFILVKGKPTVFYRQYGDDPEDIERSSENFLTTPQDIGILAVNGALLNIFSKEVNLFSSSSGTKDYQLVKEITTHQQTEEMLELLERSIVINQSELTTLRAEKRGIDAQIQSMPYFFYVNQLEELLADSSYEDIELALITVGESLSKLKEVEDLNFNSSIEHLLKFQTSLNLLQDTNFTPPAITPLDMLEDCIIYLDRIQPSSDPHLDVDLLGAILDMTDILDRVVPCRTTVSLPVEPLELLEELVARVNAVGVSEVVAVDSKLPLMLSDICIKLGQMIYNCSREVTFTNLAEKERKGLQGMRVPCPIREEVYLIEGKCVY